MLMNQSYMWVGTVTPLLIAALALLVFFIHFLPSFIAFSRDHHNRLAILILNILFGWTGFGWLILLIWSLSGQREPLRYS